MRITVNGEKTCGVINDILTIAFLNLTCDEDIKFGIKLATSEAVINAIKHGGQHIYVDIEITKKSFIVMVRDSGDGFNWIRYGEMPEPEAECGRGICLMRQFMDRVEFNNTGNCVLLVKKFEEV